jgi:3-oxoacyl-[acyl-carrier protein] reductase
LFLEQTMTHSISGRSALVTGGTKGIGKGIARVLTQAGAKVAIMARHIEQAQAAAKELGHDALGVVGDVTNLASLEQACAEAAKHNGGLDIICANAGIFPQSTLENMTEALWDEVSDTNLKGTFLTIKAALPYLKKSNQGRIVITSSITGPVTGYPGWTHYGASKAGQLGFMRTACLELARYGITVNAVMPGNIMTEGLLGNGEAYIKSMEASVPLKRLGTVEDIGHAALYFASKEAGYVTGQTIIVDGGQILPESVDGPVAK